MKTCTDLEQSRALELFLPAEKADMRWTQMSGWDEDDEPVIFWFCSCDNDEIYEDGYDVIEEHLAWSLSALIDSVPEHVLLNRFDGLYYAEMMRYNENKVAESVESCGFEFAVDAFYDLIVKLKEKGIYERD